MKDATRLDARRLKRVPVSNMRLYTAKRLRVLAEPEVICVHSDPVAVVIPWPQYREWQELFVATQRYQRAMEARTL